MTGRLFVLTGAGISAESGLATFRGQNGLWENHRIEDVASPEGFRRDPQLVQRFYNMRRAQLQDPKVQPNEAHRALVELERSWPGEFLLVTQNVDDLHERAGSKKLIHMHGELMKVRCQRTDQFYQWTGSIDSDASTCECCSETGTLRPHIVWFGEMPMRMDEIYEYLEGCSTFISIGTSGLVYPAAGFVSAVRGNSVRPRARTIELNMEPTPQTEMFDEQLVGPATKTLPELVMKLLK
ncbi:MAG: Sir2 family NAD+-dependent deacetylase [Bdellovibrionia bacterium]